MRNLVCAFCMFGLLAQVIGAEIKNSFKTSLLHPFLDVEPSESRQEDGLLCDMRQTMAWEECDEKVVCDTNCKSETDCTFPYCNSLGLCECLPVFCKTDRMCDFFMIDCHGNFTCRNRHCYCD